MVGKGENAVNQHFLLFPKCFRKTFFLRAITKIGTVWQRVKRLLKKKREKKKILENKNTSVTEIFYFPQCFFFLTFKDEAHPLELLFAQPHSSVISVADLRTRGRWFGPRLGQYSFSGVFF